MWQSGETGEFLPTVAVIVQEDRPSCDLGVYRVQWKCFKGI